MDAASPMFLGTALAVGVVHTLAGPDHYLPFVMLGRAHRWSGARLLAVTTACGLGHLLSSVALGLAVAWGGQAVAGRLDLIEGWRGGLAGWLLFGFGVAYLLWGLRAAWRGRRHRHVHAHGCGLHAHDHDHQGEHAHGHGRTSASFWTMFVIFVLGPCEPLIPIVVAAATAGGAGYLSMVSLCAAFGAATILTMGVATWLGYRGLSLIPLGHAERYAHALAGAVIAVSGAGMLWLGW